jgi:polyphenol oxidase
MRILRPVGLNSSSLLAALSTRVGGPPDSPFGMNLSFNVGDEPANVQANRDAFFNALRVKQEELAIPRQVHSSTVVRVDSPGTYPDCDALVTDKPRVFLCVSTADCVPLFIYEKEKRVLAAIHSGWRGTVAAIAVQGVQKMVEEYGADPKAMCAYIGPAASVCCYAVSPDVASRFEPKFVTEIGGNLHVDLKGTVLSQLLSVGIPPTAIDISPLCTISEAALFHSFRRDGARSGRMMGVIGLIR